MNTKLILSLLSSQKEKGFVMPLVMMTGLVIMLVGAATIVKSQSDQVSSISQKETSKASSAVEAGLTKTVNFMNDNRFFALYSDSNWSDEIVLTKVIENQNACNGGNQTSTETMKANVKTKVDQLKAFQDLDTNSKNGQVKMISYTYTPDSVANQAPGWGKLRIQAKTNQQGNGSGATSTISTATSQIEATIRIGKNTASVNLPGLWVKGTNTQDMKNDKINGSILVEGCSVPSGISTSNLANPSTQKISASSEKMPDTPSLPPSYYTDSSPTTGVFPRSGHTADANGYYHYLIPDLDLSGNPEVSIEAGKKVVFYVQGNIDLSGNPDINKNNPPSHLQIYGNTYTTSTTTKYGCTTAQTLNTDCPTLQAHFNGTGTMKALLHAPDAVGSVNGGGNTNGNFRGTVWIKSWTASSGNSKVKVDAEGFMNDMLSASQTAEPSILGVSDWKNVEASN